jgi:hypothetical protein
VNLGQVASPVDLTAFGVLPGDHVLSFYAVNDLGFISNSASVQVIAAATPTPTRSDTLTPKTINITLAGRFGYER